MSYTTKRKIEAHDAAGYETAMDDFSGYDDGYGSKVAHGDLTMQRMVEAGARDAQMFDPEMEGDVVARAYDTEPFQSQAQARKFRAMEARGEIPKGTSSRWAHHTPGGIKSLPERKK